MKRLAWLLTGILLLSGCGGDQLLSPLAPDAVILAFGDSLTAGNGAPADGSYPAQLSRLINRTVVNAGVSSEESGQGRARLERLLDQHRPRLLILCHGGNDLLRKRPVSELEGNLRAMISMAQNRGIEVLLLGVPAPGIFLNSEDVYETVADATGIAFIPEVIADVLSQPSKKSDTVHPNAAGYAEIAGTIASELKDFGAIH